MKNKNIRQVKSSSNEASSQRNKFEDLLGSAFQSVAALEWEKAAAQYTQALEIVQNNPTFSVNSHFEILEKRSVCFRHLGDIDAETSDLQTMLSLAQRIGDSPMQVRALIYLEHASIMSGQLEKAKTQAEQAVSLARSVGDRKLEAESLNALCDAHGRMGLFSEAMEVGDQAIQIFRSINDLSGEARTNWMMSYQNSTEGNTAEAHRQAERALERLVTLRVREMPLMS
jgi:tetratricopeptide (TPR) repeat protein